MPTDFWIFMGVVVALIIITAMHIRIRDMENAYFKEEEQWKNSPSMVSSTLTWENFVGRLKTFAAKSLSAIRALTRIIRLAYNDIIRILFRHELERATTPDEIREVLRRKE